ncbi:MAG: UvrD-helicase domain-containing protein, partial [Dehalococcoidia bacterium]|nr:UvrD-helicase domain-containing protein [Dehalococcoidia bacterium]
MTTDAILDPLNDAQREAVLATRGPVLIIAGPGSGKTRVIAHRIAYLIDREGVPPYRILAVTFTNKAAREMRDRVEGLLGDAARDVVLGTFHSVCARFLRVDGGRVGLARGFNIYDEEDQQALMRRALNDLGLDPKQFHPRAVLSVISRAKSELASPAAFKQSVRSYFEEVSARLYQRYQDLLAENNAVDFDDLIMKTVELLRDHPDVREKYQQRFLHVLIDEFQDTNVAQYVLARHLAGGHGNICVVGDPDQSIYSWRSADIRNILNFERDYPGAKVVALERNYRSTQRILDTAHAVIRVSPHHRERRLWTDRGEGLPVVTFEAADEIEEAEFVAAEIRAAVERGERKPGDFAVMYRTNAQSRPLEEAFIREGIPYRLVGGVRFYERREVKDVLAYLRLVYNPFDTVSFARVVNVPPRGIGARTLEELERWAAERDVPLYTALHLLRGEQASGGHPLTPRAAKALLSFLDLLDELMARANEVSLSTLLSDLLDRIAYRRYLLDQFEDGEDRWEN